MSQDWAARQAWMLLLVAGLLVGAGPATSEQQEQSQPAVAASPSAGPPQKMEEPLFAGSEACTECHQQAHNRFKNTKMGKILLVNPRTELEARGCEACHGPGAAHVESKGGLESIIRFGKKSNLSAEEQNDQCLQCHEKGMRLFWPDWRM